MVLVSLAWSDIRDRTCVAESSNADVRHVSSIEPATQMKSKLQYLAAKRGKWSPSKA